MELPWQRKKAELLEEEILKELERETMDLKRLPVQQPPDARPPLQPPVVQKLPASMPTPSFPQPQKIQLPPPPPVLIQPDIESSALSDQQISKLPLFMKVEEYDRIVADLHALVVSLEKMEEILKNLSQIEETQNRETANWREQLNLTRDLLGKLLLRMPETGRLKNIVEERKKQQSKEKFRTEVSDLRHDLKKVSAPVKKPTAQISDEIKTLRSNIGSIQQEMRSLHEDLKTLAETAKKKAEEEKKIPSYHDFPKPEYKKTEFKKPW